MTLGNMGQNGVRAVIATCQSCGHKADVNVDAGSDIFVPEASRRAAVQPMRRQTDRYETGLAYEMNRTGSSLGEASLPRRKASLHIAIGLRPNPLCWRRGYAATIILDLLCVGLSALAFGFVRQAGLRLVAGRWYALGRHLGIAPKVDEENWREASLEGVKPSEA
jgi:hypothetical protein